MTTPPKRLYRIGDAAEVLSMGRTAVFAEIRRGRLETVGEGKTRRIAAEAIDDYVNLLKKEATATRAA